MRRLSPAYYESRLLALLVTALAIWLLSVVWPLDWINPTPSTRAELNRSGFQIRYVQFPGAEFYADTVEISDHEGHNAFVYWDVDNYKCWIGSVRQAGDLVSFRCWPSTGGGDISMAWLEAHISGCGAASCNLSDVYYMWKQASR